MERRLIFCLLLLTGILPLAAQPFGIDTRSTNTTLLLPDLPPGAPGTMAEERVFPQLTFSQPILLLTAPGDDARWFVLERTGRIRVFDATLANPGPADVQLFLDVSTRISLAGEEGLLGLAFDPDYAANGHFYVYYSLKNPNTALPAISRIARFTNSTPAGNSVAMNSEVVLLEVPQPYSNHNGGMIAFGPDGMLYIGLGDGGSGGDPLGHGQNTATLLGSMLRIDVKGTPDPGLAYRIPPDNPFVAGGPAGAQTRREIFAYGLRNPWRFIFDRQRGYLLAGDVGQGQWEEVDHIQSGGNYGWKIMEGNHCYNATNCDQTGLILPLAEYSHSVGNSISGGFVYYGRLPELHGMYLYADYGTGKVWGLRYDGTTVQGPYLLVGNNSLRVAGFGQDGAGEVYVLDISGGGIYWLKPATPGGSGAFPTRLSDLPSLLAAGQGLDQTAQGIIPYAPSAKLWSDGTLKERFIALPGLDQIGWRPADGWDFGEGAVLVKNFLMPMDERDPQATAKRIETRLLVRKNGVWNGFSYEWNDAQTDAALLADAKTRRFDILDRNGQPVAIDYLYPSRNQCAICHTAAAGEVLGLNTPQMNTDYAYPASGVTDNQLRTYDHLALFDAPLPAPPDTLARMPDPYDLTQPLGPRARAYLAANCSMCHRPGGPTPVSLDLRWETPDGSMQAIGVPPGAGDLGLTDPRIVAPGDPDRSILLQRMIVRDGLNQMPPLGSSRPDTDGIALIREWIGQVQLDTGAENWLLYR